MTRDDALTLIRPFYDLFSAARRDWEAGFAVLAEDWRSYSDNEVYRTKADTRPFLETLMEQVPDIDVEIKQLIVDDVFIAVRSALSGTPTVPSPLWGATAGHPFRVMTLDIHRVTDDGRLRELYHLENWTAARGEGG